MEIVKIPKKLRDIFDILRNGEIDLGLELLEKIKGFEAQKAIVYAEINYFKSNYDEALHFDETALPFDEQWYAGNILIEHLFAYSNNAILSNNILRAEKFLKKFLAEKENLGLADHKIKFYRHQVENHLKKLHGEKNLIIDPAPLKLITKGQRKDDFISQLKEYKPKLKYDSIEGAEYLLYFMFEKGNTLEVLDYYNQYASQIKNENHHINAARLYLKSNDAKNAELAILEYCSKAWFPVEYIQIAPMKLFSFEDLLPILTKEFKEKILFT